MYKRPSQVDDTLVDLLYAPSEDPDALGVFVEVRGASRLLLQPA